MSIQYCHYCDKHIDTDYNAEHFDTNLKAECIREEEDREEALKGETKKEKIVYDQYEFLEDGRRF